MGYGAYMQITNEDLNELRTYVTNVNCMYDGGHDGSNLSTFDKATVLPAPASGESSVYPSSPQYIEAKNSGSCFFDNATFNLRIVTAAGTEIGTIDFTDSGGSWDYEQESPPSKFINVNCNNSGDQATISITVMEGAG